MLDHLPSVVAWIWPFSINTKFNIGVFTDSSKYCDLVMARWGVGV